MSETRTFPLRVVLTVTTGRLLTGIGDLYEILGYMTGESPFTHQLGRFSDECKPWLLRWFPTLVVADQRLATLDAAIAAGDPQTASSVWLAALESEIGSTFEVGRIPRDDHTDRDALQELRDMIGPDKPIIVVGGGSQ